MSAMSVPHSGGGGWWRNMGYQVTTINYLLSTSSAQAPRPGREPRFPQSLTWGPSRTCVFLSIAPTLQPSKSRRAHTQLKITLQNQPLGRQREEGKRGSPGLSSLCLLALAWLASPSPSALPAKPLCHSLDLGKGGNLREQERRIVAGPGFWPPQRQAGVTSTWTPVKVTPAGCQQPWHIPAPQG